MMRIKFHEKLHNRCVARTHTQCRHTSAGSATDEGDEKVQSRRRIINKPTLWTWQYVLKFSLISFREHKRYKEDDKLERRKCSFFYIFLVVLMTTIKLRHTCIRQMVVFLFFSFVETNHLINPEIYICLFSVLFPLPLPSEGSFEMRSV